MIEGGRVAVADRRKPLLRLAAVAFGLLLIASCEATLRGLEAMLGPPGMVVANGVFTVYANGNPLNTLDSRVEWGLLGATGVRPFETAYNSQWERDPVGVKTPEKSLLWVGKVGKSPYDFNGIARFAPAGSAGAKVLVLSDSNGIHLGAKSWPYRLAGGFKSGGRSGGNSGGKSGGEVGAKWGDFEVLNGAVPGYSTWQGMLKLERLAATLKPDLVVVEFGWNDGNVTPNPPDDEIGKLLATHNLRDDLSDSHFLAAVSRLALYRYLRGVYAAVAWQRERGAMVERVPLERDAPLITSMAATARGVGARLVVLTRVVNETHAFDETAKLLMQATRKRNAARRARFGDGTDGTGQTSRTDNADEAGGRGDAGGSEVLLFDAARVVGEGEASAALFDDVCHLNEAGAERLAAALAPVIAAELARDEGER